MEEELKSNLTQTFFTDGNANSNTKECGWKETITKIVDSSSVAEPPYPNRAPEPFTDGKCEDLLTSFCRSFVSQGVDSLSGPQLLNSFQIPEWFFTGEKEGQGFNLVKFLTACIASQLKSLGVEELDCKELVDAWLSQRRQRRWSQTVYKSATIFPNRSKPTSNSCLHAHQIGISTLLAEHSNELKTAQIFGPSEPNSSLLRLSEEGNVDLGHFLSRMEEVRANVNNASCTLLQSVSLLMLPYLKLLSGNQLETTCSRIFVQESMKIVAMMASELSVESTQKETAEMTQREFRLIESNARQLNQLFRKLYKKFKDLFQENDLVSERTLSRIHPKGLVPYVKGRINDKQEPTKNANSAGETFITDCIQFSQVPQYHANFTAAEICKNHLFFSKSSDGVLMYKDELSGEWKLHFDLPFKKRRELFLSVAEDLQWCLKQAITSASYAKELVKRGYPDNIYTKMNVNWEYLKTTAKHSEDIPVLSKVTIATQVNVVREASGRLLRVLRDACTISKQYHKHIRSAKKNASANGCLLFKTYSCKANSKLNPSNQLFSMKFESPKAKYLIPLTMSTEPLTEQFSISFA